MAGLVVASAILKGVLSNLSSPVLNEFWLLWGVGEDKDKLQSNLSAINAVLQDAERRQVNEMAVKDWLRKIKDAVHDVHLTPSLKQCFAYCAVIPKGRRFVKHELIKQWIALGFIHSDEENELLEEKAEGYFNQLLQRSLFSYDGEFCYNMHDLIHDLVRFVGEKECFIVKASMNTVPKETRHLKVQDNKWAREPENVEALKQCKKLRSMSFYGRRCFVDINACLSLTCLRVLDLNNTDISYLPNSIDKLKHLRYLDVSSTSITELPETICNLHSLQTLMIRDTWIRMLPKNMKRMISLRHIEFDVYRSDSHLLPKGIGELTCLRTLPAFVVGEESGPRIEELKGLNQLCGDFRIRRLNHVRNGECAGEANLKAKKHLHSLELSWSLDDGTAADTEGNSEELIENLEPHSRLKELAVEEYMGMQFPNWMKMLTNLTRIDLLDCNRCEHLPPLWQLGFLESLQLSSMSAVKYIVEFDGNDNSKEIFPCLKRLRLHSMFDLEGWSSQQEDGDGDEQGREGDEQVILQGLRILSINDCPKLTYIPWLRHLSSLTSLKISNVGWDKIEIPASQSLTELSLCHMPNLERWSVQKADDDDDGQMIFSSLRQLKIDLCPNLICLPQLLLPALETLDMYGVSCDKIEFSTSHSLQHVWLLNMPNLERLSLKASNDNEHVVLCPLIVCVYGCPTMTRLPHLLPSSVSLGNKMLLEWVVANYTSLSRLSIEGLPEVKHLPEELGPNHTGLHTLEIIDCPKLTSLSNQLQNLLALKELIVEGCKDLVLSLPGQSPPLNSLEVLRIKHSCEKQISFPGDGIVLTSLRSLTIKSCRNLESISADMLQNLTSLEIEGCPKLWSSLVSLENLKSIERLKISGCPEMTRFLGSMENLTSLTWLEIADCPSMWSLPESVKNLKSLTWLAIKNCPAISSLPESMGDLTLLRELVIGRCPGITTLPNGLKRLENLYSLQIYRCPDLERKLRFPKGKDWHKVEHVRSISIDFADPRQEDRDRFIYRRR